MECTTCARGIEPDECTFVGPETSAQAFCQIAVQRRGKPLWTLDASRRDRAFRAPHPGRELRLTQAEAPAHGLDADVVVDRHRRPSEGCTTIGWTNRPRYCQVEADGRF